MKKVRYALGAVGLAPAIGLLMPAASTAAAQVHAPKAAKKVSLVHSQDNAVPAITCGSGRQASFISGNGHLRELLNYSLRSGGCVHSVFGLLNRDQTGLEMRTRVYRSRGGPRVFQHYVHGDAFFTGTSFTQVVNTAGEQVCIALVQSAHLSHVDYGPVCDNNV
jgi:hypothetical protein